MSDGISSHETKVRTMQFPKCERIESRQDVVFVFPSKLVVDAATIADGLQSAMSYLKDVTCIDPTQKFSSRVVIGYSETCTQPNWSGVGGNRVCLPWAKYLKRKDEPFDVCSHELVHPFYNRSALHQSNERWGDCFCEFLRGLVKEIMGLDGKGWWREKLADTRSDKQNYGNVAGQFLQRANAMYSKPTEAEDDFADRFIGDTEAIKEFVAYLFMKFSRKPFSSEFVPTTKVR